MRNNSIIKGQLWVDKVNARFVVEVLKYKNTLVTVLPRETIYIETVHHRSWFVRKYRRLTKLETLLLGENNE